MNGKAWKSVAVAATAAVLAASILGAASFYTDTEARLSVVEAALTAELGSVNKRLDRIEGKLDRMSEEAEADRGR